MSDYVLLFLLIVGVNLMPALGPPTWTILVLFTLNTNMPTFPVVLIGAIAAALGRYVLAKGVRLVGSQLSTRSTANLAAARAALERSRGRTIAALALFVISPLPSAQLFEAAGLMRVRLVPFTLAFFSGRLVSYLVYVSTAAKARETSVGEAFRNAATEPLGIAVQLVLIALLVGMTRVDWARRLSGKH